MPIKVSSLNDLVANVTDVEVSAEWYQRVLGMERKDFDPGHGKQKRISLLFGNQKVNLRPVSADKEEWVTADHEEAGSEDLCFLTETTPEEVMWLGASDTRNPSRLRDKQNRAGQLA